MLNYKINSFVHYRKLILQEPPLCISFALANLKKVSLESNLQFDELYILAAIVLPILLQVFR